jgi:hypothetical protein
VKYVKMGRVGAAEYATVIALIQEEMKK